MATASIQPIAFMRADDRVIMWRDTPGGWAHFSNSSDMPRELLVAYVKASGLSISADEDVIVLPFGAVNLPLSFPNAKIAGMHPSFKAPDVPTWDGPTTRTEELSEMGL